jgi:Amt family ammonium transporter
MKALGIVVVYVFAMSLVCYKITALLTPLRLRREHESMGLDLTQHQESLMKGEMVLN